MLYELGATLYLVPPLAGIILGRPRKRWNLNVILVLLGLLLTLFYGFTTGTRNIICAYMVTFLVSFFYASSASKWKIAVLGAIAAGVLALSTFYGIRFRNSGLRDYLAGATNEVADVKDSLYVDYNLYAVSQLVTVFPNYVDYIGWDGPIWLLVRPVPRFLWRNKPLGESVTPESALGSEGATISCTFIGESYMVAGLTGVIVTAFGLGMLARWWTKKVFSKHSDLGILIYGSGFFAIAITMRSIYMLPVAILPTIFAAIIGYWLTRRMQRRMQRRKQRRMQASRPLPRFKLDEAQA
jgi:oligosaccharide repeat unit polymerase